MWHLALLLMLEPIQTGHNLLRLKTVDIEENLSKQEYYKDNIYLLKRVDEANRKIPKIPFPTVGKKDKGPVLPGTVPLSPGDRKVLTLTLPTILPDTERGSSIRTSGGIYGISGISMVIP